PSALGAGPTPVALPCVTRANSGIQNGEQKCFLTESHSLVFSVVTPRFAPPTTLLSQCYRSPQRAPTRTRKRANTSRTRNGTRHRLGKARRVRKDPDQGLASADRG